MVILPQTHMKHQQEEDDPCHTWNLVEKKHTKEYTIVLASNVLVFSMMFGTWLMCSTQNSRVIASVCSFANQQSAALQNSRMCFAIFFCSTGV
jgi:hypothetical protein